MTKPFRPDAGCYCLVLRHSQSESIAVGALGEVDWPAGWTYYVGRSSYGWTSRFKRFQQRNRSLHWHVDYLVNSPACRIGSVILFDVDPDRECDVARIIGELDSSHSLKTGFGASDCQSDCGSHGWVGAMEPDRLMSVFARSSIQPAGRVQFGPDRSRWLSGSEP